MRKSRTTAKKITRRCQEVNNCFPSVLSYSLRKKCRRKL